MKKPEGRVSRKSRVRVPNGILYFVVYILIYPVLKIFFRLKTERSGFRPPKGAFVLLCNHMSFMDFVLVMLTVYPRRLNAVAAQKFFLYRPLNRLLPLMGCIPKNLFDPDIRAILGMKEVIKRGGGVLLFPEGRCSVDGSYMGMHTATGKLLKSLGAPVATCRIEGAYNCMPFWRKGIRLGRVRVVLADLFTAEQVKALPAEEINRAADARLSGRDAPPPSKPLTLFGARRLAEGLENILYYCPRCKREFTLETKGNTVRCSACGNEAALGRDGKFVPSEGCAVPEDIRGWYREQIFAESRRLGKDMEPVTTDVNVYMPAPGKGRGIELFGSGALRLTPEGWAYDGELRGGRASLFFPIASVPALPFDPNDDFQIYERGSFYLFCPKYGRACSKYAVLGELAYWRFAGRIRMTPGGCGFSEVATGETDMV